MKYISAGVNHFLHFHEGTVNIALHILGFLGVFYSIFTLDWKIFAVSLVVVESGHVYNHISGIEKYDMRPKVLFWRILIFFILIIALYFVRGFLG